MKEDKLQKNGLHFFNGKLGAEPRYVVDSNVFRFCKNWGDSELDKEVGTQEVNAAINYLKNGKTGGSDGVSNEVYNDLVDLGENMLAKVFTDLYNEGNISEKWK